MPDDVAVWPTHGAGSFCSAPPGAERTSSIGAEKATNPLLRATDEDAFVAALLGSLGSFPPYFLRLAEVNRSGPAPLDGPPVLAPVTAAQAHLMLAEGAVLVDVRPVTEFAAGHVPGSLSIPLRGVFATWLGWVAPHELPLLVLRAPDQDPDEVVWQAAKVGYDTLAGEIAGGIHAWTAAGLPAAVTPLADAGRLDGQQVLDVRQRSEFEGGHVPGARHVELGDLSARAADLPEGPTVVMCGHGERAMTAASLLERAGHRDVSVLVGGPVEWAAAHASPLDTGA